MFDFEIPGFIKVYRADLSASGGSIEVPLGTLLYYRLEYINSNDLQLILRPVSGTIRYDYRRFNSWNGVGSTEGSFSDDATLSGSVTKDSPVYNNSREMHWVVVRAQNPVSTLWSTYEVRVFPSAGAQRVTIWVTVIEEEVSYLPSPQASLIPASLSSEIVQDEEFLGVSQSIKLLEDVKQSDVIQ